MPKMIPPNVAVYWVPIDAVATTDDLFKSTTYTGASAKAVNISCAIVTGMTLGATESDTDDSRSICDSGNAKTPTIANYEASLTFTSGGRIGMPIWRQTRMYSAILLLLSMTEVMSAAMNSFG